MKARTAKWLIPVLLLLLLLAGVAVVLLSIRGPGRHAGATKPVPAVVAKPAARPVPTVAVAAPTPVQKEKPKTKHRRQVRGSHAQRPAPVKAVAPVAAGAAPVAAPVPVPRETSGVAPPKAAPAPTETTRVTAPKPAPAPVETTRTAAATPAAPAAPIAPAVPTIAPATPEPQPSESIPKRAGDTAAPQVHADPAGGLYYGPVSLFFHANKPCAISWRFEPDTTWHEWHDDSISIGSSKTLTFRAIDQGGRVMAARSESFDIRPAGSALECPKGMVPVENGTMRFCIDAYEWPDRKGARPASYVSIYEAMDSCANAGKRLCTAQEWSLACGGPRESAYPYGAAYERSACVTTDTANRASGAKSGCRSYYGAFDMSGNLAEWTSSPSSKDPGFYRVMGGFWGSGPLSGCFDSRYSYFPQNRHNPVGFRCCRDLSPVAGK